MNVRILAALGIMLCVVPFFVTIVPPMTDVSQHILVAHVLTQFDEPSWRFDTYFDIGWSFFPGILAYGLLALLQTIAGPLAAAKLYLTLFAVLTYVSVRTLAQVRGSSNFETAALAILPLAFCWYVYMGFLPFVMTLPLFALGIAAWSTSWNPAKRILAVWFLLLLSFGFHIVGAAALAAVIGVQSLSAVLLRKARPAELLWAVLATSLLPILLLSYLSATDSPAITLNYSGPVSIFIDLIKFTVSTLSTGATLLLCLWLVALLACAIVAARRAQIDTALVIGATVLLGIACIVPVDLGALWPAGPRLLPFALILLSVALPWNVLPRVVPVASIVLLAGLSGFTAVHAHGLSSQYEDFLSGTTRIENGKRLLPIIGDPHAGSRWVDPFWSIASLYTVERGGANPYVFAIPYVKTAASPLRYRDYGQFSHAFLYQSNVAAERYVGVSDNYDYVLLWGTAPDIERVVAAEMDSVWRKGELALYTRRETATEASPPSYSP